MKALGYIAGHAAFYFTAAVAAVGLGYAVGITNTDKAAHDFLQLAWRFGALHGLGRWTYEMTR